MRWNIQPPPRLGGIHVVKSSCWKIMTVISTKCEEFNQIGFKYVAGKIQVRVRQNTALQKQNIALNIGKFFSTLCAQF